MEMLGSSERSDPLVHMVFDARVYFFTMVVGLVLPPRHGGLQMFLNQLNGSSSVFEWKSMSSYNEDTQIVQVLRDDLFTRYIK